MNIVEAIILGVVQGLAEFLPISSSGHLVIAQKLLGINSASFSFGVIVHAATLCATVIVFRQKLIQICCSLFRAQNQKSAQDHQNLKLLYLIISTTLVTGTLGLLLNDFFKSQFNSLRSVGLGLIFTGALMFLPQWIKPQNKTSFQKTSLLKAILIGLAQAFALLPGVSRSGSTIVSGLLLGFDRQDAGQYAFLISIPVILGALIFELKDLSHIDGASWRVLFCGFWAAFASGWVALKFLLKWIRQGKLYYFGLYCWLVAILVLWRW